MKYSKIEWTDHTFNPWIGCTKVSLACCFCYAAALDKRWGHDSFGKGKPRRRTSVANWRQPLKWAKEYAELVRCANLAGEHPPRRPRVFCASLADWLDDEVPIEWLADLLDLIRLTPELDWLLLTKRPENWRRLLGRLRASYYEFRGACKATGSPIPNGYTQAVIMAEHWLFGASCLDGSDVGYRHGHGVPTAPANVWIGATTENQEMADKRIPELLQIPARVRFLSCEPLLGPVELREHLLTPVLNCPHKDPDDGCCGRQGAITPECHVDACHLPEARQMLHWVICGGESGHGARPLHPEWARSLRDQCSSAGVPFLFKQWGKWAPDDGKGANGPWHVFSGGEMMKCLGKKAAGRLLDGVQHDGYPSAWNL